MPVPAGGDDDLPDLPSWTPTGPEVAAYVPHRTLTRAEDSTGESGDTYQLDFGPTTRPTGVQAGALIERAGALVGSRVAPMHVSSQAPAKTVAAMLAAAWVERGWPQDDSSLQRANDLEKTALGLLADLVASNDTAWQGDQDPGTLDQPVGPAWSFPPPDPRYDDPAYF